MELPKRVIWDQWEVNSFVGWVLALAPSLGWRTQWGVCSGMCSYLGTSHNGCSTVWCKLCSPQTARCAVYVNLYHMVRCGLGELLCYNIPLGCMALKGLLENIYKWPYYKDVFQAWPVVLISMCVGPTNCDFQHTELLWQPGWQTLQQRAP